MIFTLYCMLLQQLFDVNILGFLLLFDHSSIHSVVFIPLVVQDFLCRVDLESFAFSVLPLLFEPSALWGRFPQNALLGRCLCLMAGIHCCSSLLLVLEGSRHFWVPTGSLYGTAGLNMVLAHKELQRSDKNYASIVVDS